MKGIPFSGPMVRAIMEGRKTQTRRIIRPQPGPEWDGMAIMCHWYNPSVVVRGEDNPGPQVFGFANEDSGWRCPYQPNERLYVKEALVPHLAGSAPSLGVSYEADGVLLPAEWPWRVKRLPSIFMPRKYARTFIEIGDIRVERVQEIGEDDARQEGCWGLSPVVDYEILWDSLHDKPGERWEDNCFVWAYTFKRV